MNNKVNLSDLNDLQKISETEEYGSDYQKAMELTKEIEEVSEKIAKLYEEWEKLI